jgi:hypothetical protein
MKNDMLATTLKYCTTPSTIPFTKWGGELMMEGHSEPGVRFFQAAELKLTAVSTSRLTTVLSSPTTMESALLATHYYCVIKAHIPLKYNIPGLIA